MQHETHSRFLSLSFQANKKLSAAFCNFALHEECAQKIRKRIKRSEFCEKQFLSFVICTKSGANKMCKSSCTWKLITDVTSPVAHILDWVCIWQRIVPFVVPLPNENWLLFLFFEKLFLWLYCSELHSTFPCIVKQLKNCFCKRKKSMNSLRIEECLFSTCECPALLFRRCLTSTFRCAQTVNFSSSTFYLNIPLKWISWRLSLVACEQLITFNLHWWGVRVWSVACDVASFQRSTFCLKFQFAISTNCVIRSNLIRSILAFSSSLN